MTEIQDGAGCERAGTAGALDLHLTVETLIARVMELEERLHEARSLAEEDPLTRLPNSRAMRRILAEAMALGRSRHRRFALLLVDGDNLRAFNDLSYAAGDRMIVDLAARLSGTLRAPDRIARWRCGDEFLILLPDADAEVASRVAERLVGAVREGEWLLPVTISVGVALFPEHGRSADALIDEVERALSAAKAQGKDRAVLALQPAA